MLTVYDKKVDVNFVDKNKNEADYYCLILENVKETRYDFWFYRNRDNYELGKIFIGPSCFSNSGHIWDFHSMVPNIGYGSSFLLFAEKYLKEKGVKALYGSLTPVDKDHFDKLEYFYKKNGYDVYFSDDRESGSIKKRF